MKITLSNDSIKKLDTAVEISIVLNLEDVNKYDKEILDDLNFKAKDEEVVFLVESKKIYVGCEEESYDAIAIAIS
ncbi:MAG: leucyl aminopeptidase, partial [Arcobacter sp.]